MPRSFRHCIAAALAVLAGGVLVATAAVAADADPGRGAHKPSLEYMLADGLVLRPLGLAATIIGGAIYAVTLPFSLAGGNADEAAETFVTQPVDYTFRRCLGCLEDPAR
ncbi:MAG: hypothetical protein IT495_22095 [Gammaproteobacteria bacterium]|nr:hypothetical protein [Gammaproteobacteria bacterium]